MEIEFDPAKSERNVKERGIPFTFATEFDWDTGVVIDSARRGEDRKMAVGFIRGKLHVLVHTRRGKAVRVISLRRANRREIKWYEKAKPRAD